MAKIEELRESRKFMGDFSVLESKHVAYLGLYNAERFLNEIVNWLALQDRKDIGLLVCDNKSVDGTWSLAVKQISEVYPKSVFVQTPINLGGYGAFSLNFDLFEKSNWITTFHQDDKYRSNHLAAHADLASKASADLGIIASEQESYSPSGKRLGFPRAHWFLPKDADPATVFLTNLRRHSLPFSGASFNFKLLQEIGIPWHSTAFPDTELVLRMLPNWTGFVDSSTVVEYLENPLSESHSIENSERSLGVSMSLSRVFSSKNFSTLCRQVVQSDRENFVYEVIAGIDHRIQDPLYRNFTNTLALEVMFQEFGPISNITKNLEATYLRVGAIASSQLLHELHTFPGDSNDELCLVTSDGDARFKTEPSRVTTKHSFFKNAISRLLGMFPRSLRRWVLGGMFALAKKLGIRTSWQFDWKKTSRE